jgi:hypothetical protein
VEAVEAVEAAADSSSGPAGGWVGGGLVEMGGGLRHRAQLRQGRPMRNGRGGQPAANDRYVFYTRGGRAVLGFGLSEGRRAKGLGGVTVLRDLLSLACRNHRRHNMPRQMIPCSVIMSSRAVSLLFIPYL